MSFLTKIPFFKQNKKGKPPESLELFSEDELLEKLILRLENTPLLSRAEADKKNKLFNEKIVNRMIDEGITRGVAADDHQMYNQSEHDFKVHLKDTDNDLFEQISILNFGLDRWFEYGETHPPYFPWRIAVILSKRKEFETEKRFLAAYCKHFKFRVGTRDQEITRRAIKKNAISAEDVPNKSVIILVAKNLVEEHGYTARKISDQIRTKAYQSGSEAEFLKQEMIRNEVMRLTINMRCDD